MSYFYLLSLSLLIKNCLAATVTPAIPPLGCVTLRSGFWGIHGTSTFRNGDYDRYVPGGYYIECNPNNEKCYANSLTESLNNRFLITPYEDAQTGEVVYTIQSIKYGLFLSFNGGQLEFSKEKILSNDNTLDWTFYECNPSSSPCPSNMNVFLVSSEASSGTPGHFGNLRIAPDLTITVNGQTNDYAKIRIESCQ